jgi:hypothetical protein
MADTGDGLLPVVGLRLMNGRVGSTLLMQLLATSPRIVFDREYPYGEYRYLSYCARIAGVVGGEGGRDRVTPFFFSSTAAGPIPWEPQSLDRTALAPRALRALWSACSDGFREQNPAAALYAEKLATDPATVVTAGIPLRIIDLVRDPRDVLASIRAFTARGVDGFDRTPETDEAQYLEDFVARTRERLTDLAELSGCDQRVLRYEDVATDLHATATAVGAWLGEPLDADTVLADRFAYARHVTTDSVDASIGRWRADLAPAEAAAIWDGLSDLLEPLGYARG